MKKALLLVLGGVAAAALWYANKLRKAVNQITFSVDAGRISINIAATNSQQLGLFIPVKITNPTDTTLSFDGVEGVIMVGGNNSLSVDFTPLNGVSIKPGVNTYDVPVAIPYNTMGASITALAAGWLLSGTLNGVSFSGYLKIAGINLPVGASIGAAPPAAAKKQAFSAYALSGY